MAKGKSRPEFLIFFGLLAAAFSIYAQTLGFGFITFDDPGYVSENPHVFNGLSWGAARWAFTSVEQSNWHPLTWLSLQCDAQLYGLNAGGFHLTNLLLHVANAWLLFAWLRRATKTVWPAALTAFFFVVHPMHVESVAWVTERKDVLSTFFFLLTLIGYTHYAQHGDWRAYGAALGCYALGLLAKPMLVSLPALLLLLDYWPLRRVAPGKVRLAEKIPFFTLAAISCAVTLAVQRRGAAVVPLTALPIGHRLGAALLGYATYLGKTFYPVRLGVYYPFWRGASTGMFLAAGGLLAIVSVAAVIWRRDLPWLWLGWGWFLGTLVPVIGLVQVGGQAVADRYTYLPHIGLCLMIFWTAAEVWRRWAGGRWVLASLGIAAGAACLGLSVRQAGYWRSSPVLFEHALQVAEPSDYLYRLLGDARLNANEVEAAAAAYRQAWRLQPADRDVALQLGVIDLRQERWGEAAELFARLAARPDADGRVFNNEALALARLGRNDEAEQWYRRALGKDDGYALAHFGLADVLRAGGQASAAAEEYRRGLARRDDWIPALAALAWIDALNADPRRHTEAVALARRAVSLSRGEELGSLDALAAAEAATGNWDAAVRVASAACQLADKPGSAPAAGTISRERLEAYQAQRMPSR